MTARKSAAQPPASTAHSAGPASGCCSSAARELGTAPGDAMDCAEIQRLAYLRAESRGFAPGQELDDWLWAEAVMLTEAHSHRDRSSSTSEASDG